MKVKSESEVAQSCLIPSDPMDCRLPGSSIHGIFQARVLEWGGPSIGTQQREIKFLVLSGHLFYDTDLLFPAAATAKSLQSCPTLCDPIDGSAPGSPVPGILQARTLEWVNISYSFKKKLFCC